MLVVADTSPINYLVLLAQTALLPALYTCNASARSYHPVKQLLPSLLSWEGRAMREVVL